MSTSKLNGNGWREPGLELERAEHGNIGHCIINHKLYPAIMQSAVRCRESLLTLVDLGGGTGVMDKDLLYANPEQVPALQRCNGLVEQFRARIENVYVLDIDENLLCVGMESFADHDNIHFRQVDLGKESYPLKANSVDGAFSRNVAMHLTEEELAHHNQEVARILKPGASYNIAVLNPAYQKMKLKLAGENHELRSGKRFEYPLNGCNGDLHSVWHSFHLKEDYLKLLRKNGFHVEDVQYARPMTDEFRETHKRYYGPEALGLIISARKRRRKA